jgi:hypothetical protein
VVVPLVLGIFSWRKLLVLGQPSDGEVELTGGAPVMGGGDRCRHGVRRSRAEAWMKSRARERGDEAKGRSPWPCVCPL